MSSVAELVARIEEISCAIDRQKRVLADLETSRSNVRRDLNALCDPIARLPLEISSNIFMKCLPKISLPLLSSPPLLFLSVCHGWSDIAVSTAFLWSSLRVESSLKQGFLETWLARARSLPLDLSLSQDLDDSTREVIKQYAHQVQFLQLAVHFPDELGIRFPSLERLTVLVVSGGFDEVYLDACMETLRHAPLLVQCELVNISVAEPHRIVPECLTLPYLRHLRLGEQRSDGSVKYSTTSVILRRLTLPALESLSISELDIPADDLTSFFVRSSPPLQSLYIATTEDHPPGMDFLYFIPGLTDFTMHFRHYTSRNMPGLETIASGRGLAQLRHFAILGWSLSTTDQKSMLDALSSRHTLDSDQLESFRLILPGGLLTEDLVRKWQGLARDRGLDIYVGTS
ncbi:hypothetical protein B0H16DRAFT_1570539 [Mycena metata]|uniref:F-box domain-containing protein n=1 Tax=Mycena metata TaxID=1033252 RepID=A0AAD7IBS5_9AGAR|nr:hypothetical protein B0H16DRAFT_1570539 [Mycena metata]